ncbi:MAG: methionine--tRNA ligase [Verrucomicrobia bacterium]|nr:methionine--tRNA ligase [Verrucomicrobiota bacterium]
MHKRFYITTAIDYVNGQPHLGHAYEKILADVIARARRARGEEVFFLTGLDEHGQKVQQAAQSEQRDPQTYCDRLADQWRAFAEQMGISCDDFVRTTSSRHQQVVQTILTRLHASGHFYKTTYQGFYSTKEETFLTEKDRRADGTFDPAYGEVVTLSEENYNFRLGEHQAWLTEYILAHPEFIQPEYRRNEILGFLRSQKLEDLCISRPRARLAWGIPLPFDRDYVTYVWFDALVNYVSIPAALGDPGVCEPLGLPSSPQGPRIWPADIHLIGKDILKFHAVYWPIMLKAMGLPLPRMILAHGWWQKDSQKMSKSTGNVVDPLEVTRDWGVDAFRFHVVRELDIGPDGNWTDASFQGRYNAELANGLGNLVNRSLSMLRRYRQGLVPAPHAELAPDATRTAESVYAALDRQELQKALVEIGMLITRANQFVDQTAPFKLAKDPSQSDRLDQVLYNLAEVTRVLGVLLAPFLPGTSRRIHEQLGLPAAGESRSDADWGGLKQGHQVGEPAPLFPRRDLAK